MKLASVEDALLLASTAAALSRRGWPAAKTAALLAESLPEGAARAELAAAAAALERGDTVTTHADPLTALLARGEEAGADALAGIAHAQGLELRARRTARAALAYPASVAGVALTMVLVGGHVHRTLTSFYMDGAFTPNGPGGLALVILPWVESAGWVLLVVGLGAFVATAFGAGFLPGVRSLRMASRLRQVDAALASGVAAPAAFALASPGARGFDSMPLRERERCLVAQLAARSGPGPAARALAHELERDAREANRVVILLFPIIGFLAVFLVLAVAAMALLGPIFSIV